MTETSLLQNFAALDPFQQHPPLFVLAPKFDSAAERISSRWVPAHYTVSIEHPQGALVGIVYAGELAGKTFAIAYAGTARRSAWHFRMKSMEDARERAARFFDGLNQHRELVRNRRKTSYEPHTLKVNDIITNSWGYDQTNVDWYRIVKTSRHYVWLQPICAEIEETGFMSGKSAPHVDTSHPSPDAWGFKDAKGEIEKHRASGQNVCMKYGSGNKWDGRQLYCSWYH